MEIKNIDIKLIKPYENNPRVNINAVDKVAESIKEFGFKVPLVINSDYVIINGHTRYEASKKLGLKNVPVIFADDLSEQQQNAFRIIDNKTHDYAEWDYETLEEELDKISLDMSKYGFEENTLDFIDEMIDSGIAGEGNDKEVWGLQITFEKKYEDLVKEAISKYGKEMIVQNVLDILEEN